MLENLWSKKRIFEVYLNVIEWGNGVFGAEAAARHYYNVSAAQLGAGAIGTPRRHGSQSSRFYDRSRAAPGSGSKNSDHSGAHAKRRSALKYSPIKGFRSDFVGSLTFARC
jgi:hypothetical protein